MLKELAAAVVLVMPFSAVPVGMNDEVLPSPAERGALRDALVQALDEDGIHAVAADAACSSDDARCYRELAQREHARFVLSGYVTRYMALLWSLQIQIRDVRGGRSRAYAAQYKGDFDAIVHAMPEIAGGLKRAVR